MENKRWIALMLVLSVLGAALVTWLIPPVYEGETTVRIDKQKSMSLGMPMSSMAAMGGGMSSLPGLGADGELRADMLVLHSRTLAEEVVDSLSLHVELTSPRVPRSSVVEVISAPRDAREAAYELRRQPDGTYHLIENGVRRSEGSVVAGRPFRAGDVTLAVVPPAGREAPERIQLEVRAFRDVVKDFREDLQVMQPDQDAPILSVRYRSSDPVVSAAVPNAATTLFIRQKSDVARSEGRTTMDFLKNQIGTYSVQLADAEAALKSYRQGAEVINPTAQSEQQVKQLAELQAQRNTLAAEATSLRALLTELGRSGSDPVEQLAAYRQLASFPAFLTNATVQAIFASLIELENERSELLVLRTGKNSDVQAKTERIRQLELQLYQLARSYLQSLESQLASVDNNLAGYNAKMASIPAREVEFFRLARQQALLEQVYNLLQTQLTEAEIKAAGEPTAVRVIDDALVPVRPLYPDPKINFALAIVLGLALAAGTILVRESIRPTIRSREDVLGSTAGTPVLGQIPALDIASVSGTGRRFRVQPRALRAAPATGTGWVEPRSPASQAYLALSADLTREHGGKRPHVLLLTSAGQNEGTELSAANLAWALAQRDVRTLLIDADLQDGGLYRVVEGRERPGLSEVLAGRVPLAQAVQEIRRGETGAPLCFLSAGQQLESAATALGSSGMRELLETAREEYAMVIIHAPPLAAAVDAELLGRMADGTVLIARSGVTEKEALQLASTRLGYLGIPLLGVILNDAEFVGGGSAANRLAYT